MLHLILTLEAPLMSFGTVAIDGLHPTGWFPGPSMLTGLAANALGWKRTDHEALQDMQDRLVFAARLDREPSNARLLTDYQTARFAQVDLGWTTRGVPEGRSASAQTLAHPHPMRRDYLPDARLTVAIRLQPAGRRPDLREVGSAFERPARPLFIGRKTCLPTLPMFSGYTEAESCADALLAMPLDAPERSSDIRVCWMAQDPTTSLTPVRQYGAPGVLQVWRTQMHGGELALYEAAAPATMFAPTKEEAE